MWPAAQGKVVAGTLQGTGLMEKGMLGAEPLGLEWLRTNPPVAEKVQAVMLFYWSTRRWCL